MCHLSVVEGQYPKPCVHYTQTQEVFLSSSSITPSISDVGRGGGGQGGLEQHILLNHFHRNCNIIQLGRSLLVTSYYPVQFKLQSLDWLGCVCGGGGDSTEILSLLAGMLDCYTVNPVAKIWLHRWRTAFQFVVDRVCACSSVPVSSPVLSTH